MNFIQPLLGFLVVRFAFIHYSNALIHLGVPFTLRLLVHASFSLSLLLGLLYLKQESLLYIPQIPDPSSGNSIRTPEDNPVGMRSPADQSLEFTDLKLECSDGVHVHAWYMPAPNNKEASAATLLFSHENAGNVGLRLPEFASLSAKLEVNILAYDYRGYGFSDEATINEIGLMRDVRTVWNWLEQAALQGKINRNKVFLFGRSLGGAVTIQLASELCEDGGPKKEAVCPAGIIVSNTFTSIEDMVGAIYPLLDWKFIRKRLLRLQWRSISHIRRVRFPILFIRGLRDEIVPADHILRLRDAAELSSRVLVETVPNGMHNDTWMKAGEDYFRWLSDFIAEHSS